MKPVSFPQQNVVYAKDQPEYLPLPAYRDLEGRVTSCWGLNWKERFTILFTGRIFWQQLTFNQPLQPVLPKLRFTDYYDEFENDKPIEPPDRIALDTDKQGGR